MLLCCDYLTHKDSLWHDTGLVNVCPNGQTVYWYCRPEGAVKVVRGLEFSTKAIWYKAVR